MVLIRLAHTADLPSPDELIRTLGGAEALARGTGKAAPRDNGGGRDSAVARASVAEPAEELAGEEVEAIDDVAIEEPANGVISDPRSFADVVALVAERRDAKLKVHLEEHVSLVKFDAQRGRSTSSCCPERRRRSRTSCAKSSSPGRSGAGWCCCRSSGRAAHRGGRGASARQQSSRQ